MEDFENYTFANLNEHTQHLTRLENKLKEETGEDVILVAYQKKKN